MMTIQDDETLRMYLEESLEHLADIENDLLGIEEHGADLDEELVNKVYRAAHSIKGGAGFMGLTTIKELTHEMENILGKIRSRELIPDSDIINVLLSAADALKALMNDIFNSNSVDISGHLLALRAIADAEANSSESGNSVAAASPAAAAAPQTVPSDQIELSLPEGPALSVVRNVVEDFWKQGKFVYLVQIDIEEDIRRKGKTCRGILQEMEQTGSIIGSNLALRPAAELDKEWAPDVPAMALLFATILKPGDINILFEVPENRIREFRPDNKLYPLKSDAAEESGSNPGAVAPDGSVPNLIQDETPPSEAAQAATKPASPRPAMEQDTSLRVHVSLLDQLMNLAGELVLSRNQLLQSMGSGDERGREIAGQRIDLITSELQEAIMLTRMQSIGNVFNKFPRVVRDLAASLGKDIELTVEGKDVELDKTIIEAIGDPLTHLVRNAVDHGIERPEERKRLGKSPTGQIFLKAYHEAGQVNIEISDDGKGLDGNRLAAKALEKGLISDEQAKVMSNREKIHLIFLPGFSTAEKVTDVSGRGVGMDVVKTNLDRLGGLIDIESDPGKGTTIHIKLPLTLAIIPCQIVLTGNERYAIPQVNLEELLRIPADQVCQRIERVGDADVVRLRGNLLPLIRLADVIGVQSCYTDPGSGEKTESRRKAIADRRSRKTPLLAKESSGPDPEDENGTDARVEVHALKDRSGQDRRYHAASALNIVVVSTGAMKYGLVVDELHDSEEIVVKPLGRDLKKCKGYAGATIMGDGRVALILDVSNLAQMAGLVSLEGSTRAAEVAEEQARHNKSDRQSLLIFRSAAEEQFAAPLNLVERIEKIKRSDIETVGGKKVVKYRGGSLPLFSIDEVANVGPPAASENLLVIVFVVAGREVGLLAMGPVDAIETSLEIDGQTLRQTGIMGSAIIGDTTTLFVDVVEIVQTLNPQWFREEEKRYAATATAATILFAEDSNFFRNQVKGSMEKHGFNVLEAEDGLAAWNLLQQNAESVSLVVTDIEMPNLDGFALTHKIKQTPAYAHLPVIALTTLAGEEDIARGREVGIDDYQIKLDRERLMQSIHKFLQAA